MQENQQDNAANNAKQINGEKDKKNKQRDLKNLQRKIDIIKDGEIKAKNYYCQPYILNKFLTNQKNPSLNGWRAAVKQSINEVDDKMNTDKYFVQFLTSIGRVYIQKLIEDSIEIKNSGDLDEKLYLTEDHIREAFRRQKKSPSDIDYQPLKKVFD